MSLLKRMIPRVPGRRARIPAAAVLLAAGLLLALVSCDRTDPMYPDYRIGAVEGYALSSGEGCAVYVGARALDGANEGSQIVRTMSDSTGWYHMDLPTGSYLMGVGTNSWDISYPRRNDCDTLVVQPTTRRFDIVRSRAEIRIDLPTAMDGSEFTLRLRDEEGGSRSWGSAYVENGSLEYIVPFLEPGEYYMRLDGVAQLGGFYLPNSVSYSDGDILLADPETVFRYEISYRQDFAFLGGNVSGSWQEAGFNIPLIKLYSDENIVVSGSGADSRGDFACPLFVAQPVRAEVSIGDVSRWIGGTSFEDATVFDVCAGDSLTSISLVESGILITLDDGGLTSNLGSVITLADETGAVVADVSDFSRLVAIGNLDPGRYYLHADGSCDDETWAPQWYGGSETFDGAAPIDLGEGDLAVLDMSLGPGGEIAGYLAYEDGTPLSSFRIGLFLDEEEPLCYGSGFDYGREGIIGFTGLANGAYYMALRLSDYSKWWYPGTADFTEAVAIEIVDHATVELGTWTWFGFKSGGGS